MKMTHQLIYTHGPAGIMFSKQDLLFFAGDLFSALWLQPLLTESC